MLKSDRVRKFLADWPDPNFGNEVVETFRKEYQALRRTSMLPEVIFQELLVFAGGLGNEPTPRRGAVLAVLAYLFEECEIFERPEESAPMILPTKHLSEDRALLSLGGEVLRILDEPKTVSSCMEWFRKRSRHREDSLASLTRLVCPCLGPAVHAQRYRPGERASQEGRAMIRHIYSTLPTFKTLRFNPGLNILLSEKSPGATDRQTRNGAGKTSFIELIHFLSGGNCEATSIFKLDAFVITHLAWTSTLVTPRLRPNVQGRNRAN